MSDGYNYIKDSLRQKVYTAEQIFFRGRHAGYNYKVSSETFGRAYRPDTGIETAQDFADWIGDTLGFTAPKVDTNCRYGNAHYDPNDHTLSLTYANESVWLIVHEMAHAYHYKVCKDIARDDNKKSDSVHRWNPSHGAGFIWAYGETIEAAFGLSMKLRFIEFMTQDQGLPYRTPAQELYFQTRSIEAGVSYAKKIQTLLKKTFNPTNKSREGYGQFREKRNHELTLTATLNAITMTVDGKEVDVRDNRAFNVYKKNIGQHRYEVADLELYKRNWLTHEAGDERVFISRKGSVVTIEFDDWHRSNGYGYELQNSVVTIDCAELIEYEIYHAIRINSERYNNHEYTGPWGAVRLSQHEPVCSKLCTCTQSELKAA